MSAPCAFCAQPEDDLIHTPEFAAAERKNGLTAHSHTYRPAEERCFNPFGCRLLKGHSGDCVASETDAMTAPSPCACGRNEPNGCAFDCPCSCHAPAPPDRCAFNLHDSDGACGLPRVSVMHGSLGTIPPSGHAFVAPKQPPASEMSERCGRQWRYSNGSFGPACVLEKGHLTKHKNSRGEVWTECIEPEAFEKEEPPASEPSGIKIDGDFAGELAALLNRHSQENGSDTPDFILATYLVRCLQAFNEASRAREGWYGKSLHI